MHRSHVDIPFRIVHFPMYAKPSTFFMFLLRRICACIHVCVHTLCTVLEEMLGFEGLGSRETEFELQSVTQPYCRWLGLLFNSRIRNCHTPADTYNL